MTLLRSMLGLVITLFIVYGNLYGQTINAGNDTTICINAQAKLHSTLTGGGYGTGSYTFEVYPYAPEAYTGGTGVPFGGNQDDQIAGPFNLGFSFCFFNQTYTQFYIGSNGWVGFSYDPNWVTYVPTAIPNSSPAVPKNCIMAPWEDWWPGYAGTINPGVYYYQTGTAPNRKMVIYWPESKQYFCRNIAGAETGKFQIVLNEQNSIIENHIANKPQCQTVYATQGVQNLSGTKAFTAPSRNDTLWTAANESTRFVPSGVQWYSGGYPGGTFVGYGATLNVSPIVTTIYTVVVQTCSGVTATDDVKVTVENADFTYPSYIYCVGSPNPVPVVSQPGGVFTATPPGLSISPTTGEINIAASAPGIYSIKYSLSGGCIATANKSLEIIIPPVPPINGSTDVCQGSTGNIYVTQPGMTNYQWQVSAGGTITGGGTITSNTATVTWNTTGAQTVSVRYTDSNGCISATPTIFNVDVHLMTVPTLTGPAFACMNEVSTFSTETGMNNYVWTVTGGTISGSSTSPSINIIWSAPGLQTVKVIYVDPSGCTPSIPTTVNVTVKNAPNPTLTGSASVCAGTTQTYNTEPGMNGYVWNVTSGGSIISGGGSSNAFITIKWTGAGPQSVSVNYALANGCTALTPVIKNVLIHALPVPAISGNNAICTGTSEVYSAQAGMTNYQWAVVGGTVTSGGTTGDNTVTVLWNTAGGQSVSVNFTDGNGCSAIIPVSVPITVFTSPVPAVTGPASACLNTSATYTTASGMTNYTWTVSPGGTITSGSGTNTLTVLWNTTGTQTVSLNYTNGGGCTAPTATMFPVDINVLQTPSLAGDSTICKGITTTYSTQTGMSNYIWTISAGGIITAGGTTTDPTVTVLWNTTGSQTVRVNFTVGANCSSPVPATINVTVSPVPLLTNSLVNPPICSGAPTNITLLSSIPGSTFGWTCTPGSPAVSGFANGSGNQIIQTLTNTGSNTGFVIYHITATENACSGPVTDDTVFVNPKPALISNPDTMICSGTQTAVHLNANVIGSSFTWTASGSSGNVTGYSAGNGNQIQQTLVNSGFIIEKVTYTILPDANGCTGASGTVMVDVNPSPAVTYTLCNDLITMSDAKPFALKGGSPNGGTYSGTGVSGGLFNPAVAGPGTHLLTYTYSNNWGCNNNETQNITVLSPAAFVCGGQITDPRDNQTYPTIQIGAQCWMAANLNFGSVISSVSMQRDNCSPEKYCFNDNAANCTTRGGLYQWDEVMQYDNTGAVQGLCPPSWHLPTETEWTSLFNFYSGNAFAGTPLKSTGISGFNAKFYGSRFDNTNWNYNSFVTFFWSSAINGSYKAMAHGMNNIDASVSTYPGSRNDSFSVRCIKD